MKNKLFCAFLAGAILIGSALPSFADSLWNDTSIANWYIDRRPTFVIGGLITINVQESTKATTNASFQGNKTLQNVHKWEIPAMDSKTGLFNKQFKTDNQQILNTLGATTRNGSLILDITSHIEDILPNGNLVIRGRKQIRVNDEISEITISGVIRRDDVTSQNTILSSRVANMQIDVKGTGPVSAKTTGGLLSRIFNFLI